MNLEMNFDAILLHTAISLALRGHYGQVDKGGQPYNLHWMRIASKMKTLKQAMVAVLHDVVEDSEGRITLATLREEGITEDVVLAVDAITKRKGEAYEEGYLARVKANELARAVKLEDLKDNMRLDRLLAVTEKDLHRVEKYKKAFDFLSDA